jgi:hypothetical protein
LVHVTPFAWNAASELAGLWHVEHASVVASFAAFG